MKSIGKVKYVGKSFGVESLTNGKIYDVIGIEEPFLRIIDDSGEDYLWPISKPCCMEDTNLYGKWELVETNDEKLKEILNTTL